MLKPVADLLVLTMVAGNVPTTELPQYNEIPVVSENSVAEEEPFIIIEEPMQELTPAGELKT